MYHVQPNIIEVYPPMCSWMCGCSDLFGRLNTDLHAAYIKLICDIVVI